MKFSSEIQIALAFSVAAALISGGTTRPAFERQRTDKLRNSCSFCGEQLQRNVAEVLPRLKRIKQHILDTLGRQPEKRVKPTLSPKALDTRLIPTPLVVPHVEAGTPHNEIVSFSEASGTNGEECLITFRLHTPSLENGREVMGASLILLLKRKRKARDGSKGKRILLKISKYDNSTEAEELLASLRTRVKSSVWQKIGLPITAAKSLLTSGTGVLQLRAHCKGCGRLVKPVLCATLKKLKTKSKKSEGHKHSKNVRHRKHRNTRLGNAAPMLVISTRNLEIVADSV